MERERAYGPAESPATVGVVGSAGAGPSPAR